MSSQLGTYCRYLFAGCISLGCGVSIIQYCEKQSIIYASKKHGSNDTYDTYDDFTKNVVNKLRSKYPSLKTIPCPKLDTINVSDPEWNTEKGGFYSPYSNQIKYKKIGGSNLTKHIIIHEFAHWADQNMSFFDYNNKLDYLNLSKHGPNWEKVMKYMGLKPMPVLTSWFSFDILNVNEMNTAEPSPDLDLSGINISNVNEMNTAESSPDLDLSDINISNVIKMNT